MVLSPVTPTLCHERKSENFQSRDMTFIIDGVHKSKSKKNIVFDIICLLLIIPQVHLNMAAKYGIRRRHWKCNRILVAVAI